MWPETDRRRAQLPAVGIGRRRRSETAEEPEHSAAAGTEPARHRFRRLRLGHRTRRRSHRAARSRF